MKILVTGSSGFLGKNLIRNLGSNHEIFCLKRNQPFPDFNPEVIFSLAGEIYDTNTMYFTNVQLVNDLLMQTKNISYKAFIHVGSSSEYGRKAFPMKETDNLKPTTWYEGTKAAGTMLCSAFARNFNKPVITVRPFSLYGPEDNPKKLIPTLMRSALTDKKIKLCKANHDYVYVDDFIKGMLSIIENGFEYGDVVNLGSGIQYSNEEVAKIIEKIFNIKFEVENMESKCYDSMNWVCDTNYAYSKYGWRAKTSLEKGLNEIKNFCTGV